MIHLREVDRRNSESAQGADRAAISRCSPIILSNYFKSRGFLENKRRAWGAERNGLKRKFGRKSENCKQGDLAGAFRKLSLETEIICVVYYLDVCCVN